MSKPVSLFLQSLVARRLLMNATSSSADLMAEKSSLRKTIRIKLKSMSAEQKLIESSGICTQVLGSTNFFKSPVNLGLYIQCEKLNEVDTHGILEKALTKGQKCYVPKVEDKRAQMSFLKIDCLEELQPSPPYGILEPGLLDKDGKPRENALQMEAPLDVLFMPGLAFDSRGGRLGRGGGYYDNFVNRYKTMAKEKGWMPPLLVALAFQCQIVDEVPMGQGDVHVDAVVTSNKIITCSTRSRTEL